MNISAEYDWISRAFSRYAERGLLMPPLQRKLYKKIGEGWCGGRTVVDIGSGLGIGSNILSHTARHVWGLDVNKDNVHLATQAFARPNIEFAILDIENAPSREISPFEIVVCVEVLEHLEDYNKGINSLKRFFSDKLQTVGFVTVPNINNPDIKIRDDKNELHLHRWTPGEFYDLMIKNFKSVTLYSVEGLKNWDMTETVDGSTTDELIVAKVEGLL